MKEYSKIQKDVILRLLDLKNNNPNCCWMSNFIYAPTKFQCLLPFDIYIDLEIPTKARIAIRENSSLQPSSSVLRDIHKEATTVLGEIVDLINTLEAKGFITLGKNERHTPFLGSRLTDGEYAFADILHPELQKEVLRIADSTITIPSNTLQQYVDKGFMTTEEKRQSQEHILKFKEYNLSRCALIIAILSAIFTGLTFFCNKP